MSPHNFKNSFWSKKLFSLNFSCRVFLRRISVSLLVTGVKVLDRQGMVCVCVCSDHGDSLHVSEYIVCTFQKI